jgi:hypothetical protein
VHPGAQDVSARLALDHGQDRRPPEVPAVLAGQARAAALAVARKAGVRHIGGSEVRFAAGGGRRTVYRIDVRSPEEYVVGSPGTAGGAAG